MTCVLFGHEISVMAVLFSYDMSVTVSFVPL